MVSWSTAGHPAGVREPDGAAAYLTAFGLAVRRRREKLGMSQEQFAFAAELDRTYVSGIERGGVCPVRSEEGLAPAPASASGATADGFDHEICLVEDELPVDSEDGAERGVALSGGVVARLQPVDRFTNQIMKRGDMGF